MSANTDPNAAVPPVAVPPVDPAEVVELPDVLLASLDMGDDPEAPPTNEDEIEEA